MNQAGGKIHAAHGGAADFLAERSAQGLDLAD
jgi:hypothetical protein